MNTNPPPKQQELPEPEDAVAVHDLEIRSTEPKKEIIVVTEATGGHFSFSGETIEDL